MAARKRLTIAANAAPKRGGQGLNLQHMLEGLREAFDLTAYCGGPTELASAHVVPRSRVAALAGSIPVLRRGRHFLGYLDGAHFDAYVAAHLAPSDIFQGVTGQCLRSLDRAKSIGCRTVLDVVTAHIDEFVEEQRRECAWFGVAPATSERLRARILDEYSHADLIRVMSERARNGFLDRGFSEQRVIAVNPHLDISEFPAAEFREGRFRVSFVGLIEPWKGIRYLIEGFNRAHVVDSELVLWGGTGARPIARYIGEAIAKNRAITMNPVEVRRVGYGEVYGRSSVLVHPSLSDGFGYTVAEAMASGIPVIVTETTGAAELVNDGVNGYVVRPRDSDGIADRVAHLARNPSLLRRMGRAARQAAAGLTLEKFRRTYAARLLELCTDAESASNVSPALTGCSVHLRTAGGRQF
jgi:glycosyltransferase involved in cell wall biosynthesis